VHSSKHSDIANVEQTENLKIA